MDGEWSKLACQATVQLLQRRTGLDCGTAMRPTGLPMQSTEVCAGCTASCSAAVRAGSSVFAAAVGAVRTTAAGSQTCALKGA